MNRKLVGITTQAHEVWEEHSEWHSFNINRIMRISVFCSILLFCFLAKGQTFDTEFKYPDSSGKNVIIQNSLPKGGLKYSDPEGSEYAYVVFWTRITNQSDSSKEIEISFSSDTYQLIQSFDTRFKLFIPSNRMTLDKEHLFLYGLSDLKSVLDAGFNQKSGIQHMIDPNDSYLFYVVALFDKRVDGVVRAGFSLKGQKIIYTINGTEIECGSILK
ncbi:hypothetical protein LCM02_02720 [Lutimonas saemankumensis]|uniref:hypothetical protein n=1 Tax=Lutimonas saemankumensis TaxID=483016 RepID=UPI001CD68268|nr:hypothetical protein [Lutimonas saemankumensis]MCA0931349.1 hypothetical protein [Lutimonas saemankumensis]